MKYFFLLMFIASVCFAGGHRASGHSSKRSSVASSRLNAPKPHKRASKKPARITGESRGRIKPGYTKTREFKRRSGHPNGKSGYVVGYKKALKDGGADDPNNMEWQKAPDPDKTYPGKYTPKNSKKKKKNGHEEN